MTSIWGSSKRIFVFTAVLHSLILLVASRNRLQAVTYHIPVQNKNGVLKCEIYDCPAGSVNCDVTKHRAVPGSNKRFIETVCFDKNQRVLKDAKYSYGAQAEEKQRTRPTKYSKITFEPTNGPSDSSSDSEERMKENILRREEAIQFDIENIQKKIVNSYQPGIDVITQNFSLILEGINTSFQSLKQEVLEGLKANEDDVNRILEPLRKELDNQVSTLEKSHQKDLEVLEQRLLAQNENLQSMINNGLTKLFEAIKSAQIPPPPQEKPQPIPPQPPQEPQPEAPQESPEEPQTLILQPLPQQNQQEPQPFILQPLLKRPLLRPPRGLVNRRGAPFLNAF